MISLNPGRRQAHQDQVLYRTGSDGVIEIVGCIEQEVLNLDGSKTIHFIDVNGERQHLTIRPLAKEHNPYLVRVY